MMFPDGYSQNDVCFGITHPTRPDLCLHMSINYQVAHCNPRSIHLPHNVPALQPGPPPLPPRPVLPPPGSPNHRPPPPHLAQVSPPVHPDNFHIIMPDPPRQATPRRAPRQFILHGPPTPPPNRPLPPIPSSPPTHLFSIPPRRPIPQIESPPRTPRSTSSPPPMEPTVTPNTCPVHPQQPSHGKYLDQFHLDLVPPQRVAPQDVFPSHRPTAGSSADPTGLEPVNEEAGSAKQASTESNEKGEKDKKNC